MAFFNYNGLIQEGRDKIFLNRVSLTPIIVTIVNGYKNLEKFFFCL